MTQDEIIEMAKRAGIVVTGDAVLKLCQLVAEKEREACADICDRFQARDVGMQPAECAGAIRARGQA
jgi:hypothetical protein